MSWTLSQNTNSEERTRFENALKESSKRNILMFGVIRDKGRNTKHLSYPGKAMSEIICIGGAGIHGEDENATANEPDFTFPGSGLGDLHIQQENLDQVSGSSIATALASGLAALVLHCADITNYGNDRKHLRRLGTMKDIFKSIAANGPYDSKNKYVAAQTVFKPGFVKYDWEPEGRKMLKDVLKKLPMISEVGY